MNKQEQTKQLISQVLENCDFEQKIEFINSIREFIHKYSPFKNEPVDFVKWVKSENVVANDYNPNKVAPPEMELLEISIMNDGYTQPVVTFSNGDKIEVEPKFGNFAILDFISENLEHEVKKITSDIFNRKALISFMMKENNYV